MNHINDLLDNIINKFGAKRIGIFINLMLVMIFNIYFLYQLTCINY